MSLYGTPLGRVVLASCSKWVCLFARNGSSKDEVEAMAAQRKDYGERLYRALVPIEKKHRPRALSVVAKVLGEVESEPYDRGIPEVRTLVNRVRNLLGDEPASKSRGPVMCAPCGRDGGYRVFANSPLMDPAPAIENHWRGSEPPEPMCVTHYEEWAYLQNPDANKLPQSLVEFHPSEATQAQVARWTGGILIDEPSSREPTDAKRASDI